MASASNSRGPIVGINVTPLVDITLVLLIIFMVTAKLIASQSVPLDLPKAATAGSTQTVFSVSIDEHGKVFENGHAVSSRAALSARARSALAKDPELRTLISASKRASHGTVLEVMDGLRQAGVVKIAFGADKSEPSATFEGTRK